MKIVGGSIVHVGWAVGGGGRREYFIFKAQLHLGYNFTKDE